MICCVDSYFNDSQVEEILDIVQICDETSLDFTQANLSKKIPKLLLINAIINEYSEAWDIDGKCYSVSQDLLEEIVKEGSDILMPIKDDMIPKLTEALGLQTMLGVKCEMRFKACPDEGSWTDHDIDNLYNDESFQGEIQENVKVKNKFKSTSLDKLISFKNNPGVNTTRESRNPKLMRSKTVLKSFASTEEEVEFKPPSKCEVCCEGTKMRYSLILIIILCLSIAWFFLFAIIAFFHPMYDMFGVGILFSRGAALAIIVLTMIAMFLVTYDVTTMWRNKLKRTCSTLFDFQLLFHRFCGFLIFFYSIVHTIGHLTGSARGLSGEKDVNKINHVLTHKEFDKHLSYHEILFMTIPGVTGIILLIIITMMSLTSLEKVRRKCFQLFATTHVICFPLFIILIVVHGSDTWLNYGFPLGSITVLLSLILYVWFWVRKMVLKCRGGFEIERVEVSENDTFCYLHIKKPKHYKMIEGQYAFLNCPDVSFWQWHPFSICSSTKNENITFLIKNNGNFTSKLIKLFKTKSGVITTNQELGETPRDSELPDSHMPPIKHRRK